MQVTLYCNLLIMRELWPYSSHCCRGSCIILCVAKDEHELDGRGSETTCRMPHVGWKCNEITYCRKLQGWVTKNLNRPMSTQENDGAV